MRMNIFTTLLANLPQAIRVHAGEQRRIGEHRAGRGDPPKESLHEALLVTIL